MRAELGPKVLEGRDRKLEQETRLSERQISDITSMVGYNYSSVIREARVLRQQENK